MEEYLETWEHVAKKKKTGWKMAVLGKSLEAAFSGNKRIVRWAVRDFFTKKIEYIFYYTPVTDALRKEGEKLGNYLHSMKHYKPEGDQHWAVLRSRLDRTALQLELANTGTLLGPPLMHPKTRKIDMRLEVPPGFDVHEMAKMVMNRTTNVDVSYHDGLPEKFEPEAIIWRF